MISGLTPREARKHGRSVQRDDKYRFPETLQKSFLASQPVAICDSIFCSERFSVKKSFVHCCISDTRVLQCRPSFSSFKLCKFQPVIDQLLILEPRSCPITKCGIYTVIPKEAVHWSVDSARYAPTNDSAHLVFEKFWTSMKSSILIDPSGKTERILLHSLA